MLVTLVCSIRSDDVSDALADDRTRVPSRAAFHSESEHSPYISI